MNYNVGDIISVKKDFYVPGSGMTFYYYRGEKYIIERYLDHKAWKDIAFKIILKHGRGYKDGYFSKNDIHKYFENLKKERKEKIMRINELQESC